MDFSKFDSFDMGTSRGKILKVEANLVNLQAACRVLNRSVEGIVCGGAAISTPVVEASHFVTITTNYDVARFLSWRAPLLCDLWQRAGPLQSEAAAGC